MNDKIYEYTATIEASKIGKGVYLIVAPKAVWDKLGKQVGDAVQVIISRKQ